MRFFDKFRIAFLNMDKTITYIVISLMLFSLVVVYSATGRLAAKYYDGAGIYYLLKHACLLGLSFCCMIGFSMINYTKLKKWAARGLLGSYVLVGLAIVLGAQINGTSRWLEIPFIGFTFQPSEFAKISIIIMTAKIIALFQTERYCHRMAFYCFIVSCGILLGMIMWDDFSTTMLILLACAAMFVVGRLQWRFIIKIVFLLISGLALIVLLLFQFPQLEKIGRVATIKARIERFISNEEKDITGKDNQEIRSKLALASGGLIGTGPGNSIQRNYLPHPYSDFIFAIVIEEYGLLVGGVVTLAYLILLTRVGIILRRCKRVFPALLITGLGVLLTLQALMHIGVCVGFFPVTGQTLPFMSMGGSSLCFMGALVGMILSVESTFSAEAVEGKNMDYYDTIEDNYHGEYGDEEDKNDETDKFNSMNEADLHEIYSNSELDNRSKNHFNDSRNY